MRLVEERVTVVDVNDNEMGAGRKTGVHRQGRLHRAFSVFVVNPRDMLLLQKRAETKYHSGGLWTNTCCGHPRPGEPTMDAAQRRLREEMGIDCQLREIFSFTYRIQITDSLFEHEYDHVFLGEFAGDPAPNPAEVCDWQWIDAGELRASMEDNPRIYTYWLRLCLQAAITHLPGSRQEPSDRVSPPHLQLQLR